MTDLFPAFRGTEKGQSVLLKMVSQVTIVQNSQYATV